MGRAIVAGGNPNMKAPMAGIQAGTLAVGSVVKLMEGGTAVEYLVVNQGLPSNSSRYDVSCNGTWLLRKDIHSERQWHTSSVNIYESSAIHAWLNGDFLNSLGAEEREAIKQVKIPYRKNGGKGTDSGGASGLPAKVFLLGGYEVGWTTSENSYYPKDGDKLDYFDNGNSTAANNKRIANMRGVANIWWLRSPYGSGTSNSVSVLSNGSGMEYGSSYMRGIRPALILPKTALFDDATMQLKGVA